ncbi:MAG: hypothetical protein COB08_005185 [Rhodobacteraceae bacterium]|nr:hypothetical protein [Paracoccaceae bacterium]
MNGNSLNHTALLSATVGGLTAASMLLAIPAGGISSLCLLAVLITKRPVLALAVWGGVYVPVSGLWVFPAFVGPFEYILGGLGLSIAGVIFYGGAGFISWFALRRLPVLILPTALLLAEVTAAHLGLVMAPIGLFAVDSALGAMLSMVTVYGATAFFGFAASILPRLIARPFPVMFGAMMVIGLLPAPSRPEYNGPPIFGVSHRPDALLKWSSPAYAAEMLDTLTTLSVGTAGAGLTVWPENAITSTFDLNEAVASLDPNLFPLLFGITRFERAGSPELRNSAVLVTAEGVQVSDKERLVPVIETGVPFLDHSDLHTGPRKILFLDDGTKVLPLICYEAAFILPRSDLSSHLDVIIILAAESGFAEDLAASIMRRHARARELETGIRVDRVSDIGSEFAH